MNLSVLFLLHIYVLLLSPQLHLISLLEQTHSFQLPLLFVFLLELLHLLLRKKVLLPHLRVIPSLLAVQLMLQHLHLFIILDLSLLF